jgi:hypothetical protein
MSNAPHTIQLETQDGLLFVGFFPKLELSRYEDLYRAANTSVSRDEALRMLQEFALKTGHVVVVL